MKHFLPFVLLISMTACLKTRSQLEREKTFNLRAVSQIKDSPDSINQQQRSQIDSRFYGIDRDFRELYGKIEVIEQQLSQLTKFLENKPPDSSGNSATIQAVEKRITTLEKALLTIDKKLNNPGKKSEKEPEEEPKQKTDTPQKKPPTKEKTSGKTSKGPFTRAESFFDQGEFEEAIVQYDKYRKAYPKGRAYPQATFKMGLCFQKLKMDEDAKAFFRELIQRYPKNPLARKAQKILKSMKK